MMSDKQKKPQKLKARLPRGFGDRTAADIHADPHRSHRNALDAQCLLGVEFENLGGAHGFRNAVG